MSLCQHLRHHLGSPDGIVVPTAVSSQVLSEPTPAVPATPQNEPPTTSTLSAQASAENGNEAVAVRREHSNTEVDSEASKAEETSREIQRLCF